MAMPATKTNPSPSTGSASAPDAGTRPAPSPPRSRRGGSAVSARALAMLTLWPVDSTPLPRVHVEPRRPDGTLRIHDRPTGQQLVVYTPSFDHQFKAGHRRGRWYVRPATTVGSSPRSPGFASARAAIEALTAGRWSLDSLLADRRGLPLRVITRMPGEPPIKGHHLNS